MSLYVVDASVAIKLYIQETHSTEAARFFADKHEMIAPDFMAAEFTNIVWKKLELHKSITLTECSDIIDLFQMMPILYYASYDFLKQAFDIAATYKRAVYDCLYLALAVHQNCLMITDDEKLNSSLKNTSLGAHLQLIENY